MIVYEEFVNHFTRRNYTKKKKPTMIRYKINVARRIGAFLRNTPKIIIEKYYHPTQIDESKTKWKAISHFSIALGKNIFDMISDGNNIFDGNREYSRSEMIRDYDVMQFEDKFKYKIGKIELFGKVFDMKSIKSHTVNVYKVYDNGIYHFHEWKNVVSITKFQYDRLKKKYNYNWGLFLQCVFLMIFRYKLLGSLNFHCSVPPSLIKKYKMGEFFGSPLNTVSDVYYSPFEDVEKYFGSRGNFFTAKVTPGVYIANPPFDTFIVMKMLKRIYHLLDTVEGLTVIVNIPNYYYIENKSLNFIKDFSDKSSSHKNFVNKVVLEKEKYRHYNYYTGKMIPVCNTQLIVFSNIDEHPSLGELKQEWKKAVRENVGEDEWKIIKQKVKENKEKEKEYLRIEAEEKKKAMGEGDEGDGGGEMMGGEGSRVDGMVEIGSEEETREKMEEDLDENKENVEDDEDKTKMEKTEENKNEQVKTA